MKYILFLLFFSTPPSKHVDVVTRKAKAVWAYQSSSTTEFTTLAACTVNGQTILDSLDETDTVTGTGWCFCESAPGQKCPDESKQDQKYLNLKKPKISDFLKEQHFSIDGKSTEDEKKVDLGVVQLLPKSLKDAQAAAEKRGATRR